MNKRNYSSRNQEEEDAFDPIQDDGEEEDYRLHAKRRKNLDNETINEGREEGMEDDMLGYSNMKERFEIFCEEKHLSEEQKRALEEVALKRKKCVFVTGKAGTGKSLFIRALHEWFNLYHNRNHGEILITASTGIAATHIQGVTIHKALGP